MILADRRKLWSQLDDMGEDRVRKEFILGTFQAHMGKKRSKGGLEDERPSMPSLRQIYLVVSEYDVDAVITALFLILAIRFFTPLWALADYLDSQLFVVIVIFSLFSPYATILILV